MNRPVTLTNPQGKKIRARATVHLPLYEVGTYACGMTYAEAERGDARGFRVNQGSISGDRSDVNCPVCHAHPRRAEDLAEMMRLYPNSYR